MFAFSKAVVQNVTSNATGACGGGVQMKDRLVLAAGTNGTLEGNSNGSIDVASARTFVNATGVVVFNSGSSIPTGWASVAGRIDGKWIFAWRGHVFSNSATTVPSCTTAKVVECIRYATVYR